MTESVTGARRPPSWTSPSTPRARYRRPRRQRGRSPFDAGWNPDRCVPHGGHQFNLSIASAFHLHGCESYPGMFEPFGGFADGYPIEDGHVRLPDAPGIGLEQKASLAPVLRDVLA